MRYQILCNLHCVESCTLLDLVTYNPHEDTVRIRDILADTANIYRILTCEEQRHWVDLLLGAVHEDEALTLGYRATYLLNRERTLCLNPQ
jgi:hypothetical protein